MKKYLHKKPIIICLCVAVATALIALLVQNIKPKDTDNYSEYSKTTNIFTMNDKKMTLDEAYFIAKNRQAYYEEYNYTYGNSFSWDIPVELGKTYEDLVLEETLKFTKEVFVLSEYALTNDLALNDTEKKAIASNVSSFMTNSDSKIIKASHATEDLVSRVYTRTALYDKVCAQILKDVDLTIDPEDARQCLVGIVELSPQYFDAPDRIAEKICERVNSGEVIGGVANVYDATIEKTNIGKDTNIKKEAIDFCLSLKDDECKIFVMDDVYYVIYCYLADDEVATASAKEILLEEKKASYITAFVEEIEKENPVSTNLEAWETVNFDEPIYTKADIVQTQ